MESIILTRDINFDTIDGIPNNDNGKYHCYNTSLKISNPIKNIQKIALKSIELPIQFYNIRSNNGSNIFSFIFTYAAFNNITVINTLTEQNYNNISTLINDINSLITTNITSYTGFTCSVSLNTSNKIVITTNATAFTINNTILNYNILGFTIYSVLNTGSVIGTNPYNLNVDNYILIHITNLNCMSENASYKLSTFKIPLNAVNNSIVFVSENNSYKQQQIIQDKYLILDRINIIIYDRFGYPINGNGGDFSMTLTFFYWQQLEKSIELKSYNEEKEIIN
jgi:hypothetical protein